MGSKPGGITPILTGAVVALVLSLLIGALQSAGIVSVTLAHWLVAFAWLIAAVAFWESSYGVRIRLVSIMILSIALFLFDRWMVQKKVELDAAGSPKGPLFAVEGVDDPLALVPQSGQPVPPKVSKFARIKVTNIGEKIIAHVKAVVTKIDDRESSFQLAVSLLDALFQMVPSSPIRGEESLSSGETQYFDALVECNGAVCPNGELAVPYIEDGRRVFATYFENGVTVRPSTLTVRVSGDVGKVVTKSFI